ncbi:MAG: hypothetical protein R3D33_15425 [Hyphomicrobiaceae bacterium]
MGARIGIGIRTPVLPACHRPELSTVSGVLKVDRIPGRAKPGAEGDHEKQGGVGEEPREAAEDAPPPPEGKPVEHPRKPHRAARQCRQGQAMAGLPW